MGQEQQENTKMKKREQLELAIKNDKSDKITKNDKIDNNDENDKNDKNKIIVKIKKKLGKVQILSTSRTAVRHACGSQKVVIQDAIVISDEN